MIGLIKKRPSYIKKTTYHHHIFLLHSMEFLSFAQPGNYSMFAYMVTLYSIFIPMTSLGYDDRSEWNKYAITMPVTRKHLVYSKYLLSILAIGITGILCIVLILLIDKGFTSESLFTITSSLSIGVLFYLHYSPF